MEDKNNDFSGFRKRLKHLREEYLESTQKMVSLSIEISTSYYSAIETGRKMPNFHFLKQMSNVYGISLNYLLLGQGRPFMGNHPHNTNSRSRQEDGILDMLNRRGFTPKHMTNFLKLLNKDELFLKNVLHTLHVWSRKTKL